jgi:two-component system, chemotaxis family, sensor kinase Cph1
VYLDSIVAVNLKQADGMTSLEFILQVKQSIAKLTDQDQVPSELSLTNCDREPIHIPNAIQPHGVLLTFDEDDLVILQVSQNSDYFLGKLPDQLLGKRLSVLLNSEQIETIQGCLKSEFDNVNPLHFLIEVGRDLQNFKGIVHRIDQVIILELEPCVEQEDVNFFDFYKFVKIPISHIQNSQNLTELSQCAVGTIRAITGFDRVMIYRFDKTGAGHVIAENKSEEADSFLGLRYPATDIPKQAKELYRLNLLRIIPTSTYSRVLLEPELNPATGLPLDMSLCCLRSVSPLHTEYLENMGVRASMSISLMCDRQLWGLIACHHASSRTLSYEKRTICELLGQVISSEIGAKVDAEDCDSKMKLKNIHSRFVNTIANCQTIAEGFNQNPRDLMDLVSASSVVFCEEQKITSFGNSPPEESIPSLLEWIDQRIGENAIYSTNTLPTNYPQFTSYKNIASGLLALRISRTQRTYLLWFRPEVLQVIEWAGNPDKFAGRSEDENHRITPRKSFDCWRETLELQSLPWRKYEINAALEIRSRIIGIVLQKADELALLNTELERSNIELDAFAYVASHDLKEPLRGIHNYSTFLIEDYGEQLGEEGEKKLATIVRLTQRMEDLINSLLHYSRLGRTELILQPINIGTIVDNVLDMIKISQPESVEFRIPRSLPTIQCDQIQVTELFTNLISNAIKYNDKDENWVEIGYILPEARTLSRLEFFHSSQPIFFIKDNGIGIQSKHLDTIFKIFKRLHGPNKYGGGTGVGLTITKKIIERHEGQILVQSVLGEGTTFYFTFGQQV